MTEPIHWFAIKTRKEFQAEKFLSTFTDDIYFPTENVKTADGRKRRKPLIPHVLFIRTTRQLLLTLEAQGRTVPPTSVPFWIYRYPKNNEIQEIPPRQIALLRLLTATDSTRCEIYHRQDFTEGQRVRITGGPFQGYEGSVQRVKKNRHVVVRIEGICLVMLPFIHPDLLSPIP